MNGDAPQDAGAAVLHKKMSQHDTTRIVNILDRTFTFHFNNEPYELKAGEDKIWPVYICRHGAKHMLDILMQNLPEYHNTKVSAPTLSSLIQGMGWTDTPQQVGFLSRILPDWYGKNQIESAPAVKSDPNVETLKEQVISLTSLVAGLQEKMMQMTGLPNKKMGRPPKRKNSVPSLDEAIKDDEKKTDPDLPIN